jgi:DNA-binding XRE family transcriptional regulator
MDIEQLVQEAAAAGARAALQEMRLAQKAGRSDTGTGSIEVGETVRSQRQFLSLSLAELGKQVELHPTTLGKIERGERGMSLSTFAKLCRVFGYDWGYNVVVLYQ